MALHLHRAERTDLLAEGLGAMLSTPLPDPFAEELVLVSARGMERWLSQRLSHVLGRGDGADGVCAGVAFRSPRRGRQGGERDDRNGCAPGHRIPPIVASTVLVVILAPSCVWSSSPLRICR